MYRIIVVDDEVNAIEGLKILIDKERNNISEILSSTNAIDALKIIKKERPDIIISDISMPQMTGLEMIAEIKAIENYNPMIIILSGYSTFTYAQTAMSHGVKAYLLKPVDEDELNDKIDELIGEIETTKQLSFEKNIVLYGLIQKILNGDKSARTISRFNEIMAIDPKAEISLSITSFDYANERVIELSDEEIDADFEKIKAIYEKNFESEFQINSFLISNELILNICNSKAISKQYMKEFFDHSNEEISKAMGINAVTKISPKIVSIAKLPTEIVNFVTEYDESQDISILDEQLSVADFREINEIFSKIAKNFDTMFREEIESNITLALDKAIELNVPTVHFTTIFNAFLVNITTFISDAYPDLKVIMNKGNSIMDNFQSIEGAKKSYVSFVLQVFDTMTDYTSKLQNETFYNIITYVNNNFTENLTLKSLATKFYVNPIYLGRVFKKRTGTLFNEYLTDLRIEKSKVLLKKTSRKVYEIASEIGFNDPNYFIAKFLKSEGITPSQYRKKVD
ncbi:MAG: response regulator [Clostridia bacterium]